MPSPFRNGEFHSPAAGRHHSHFYSFALNQKLRRLNILNLIMRFASFGFSLAAAIFMALNFSRSSNGTSWVHFPTFRFFVAANSIVAVYTLFEIFTAFWEILKTATLLPESVQLWFDFSHDQVFAYLLLAAVVVGTKEARELRDGGYCEANDAFCVQSYISIALGFCESFKKKLRCGVLFQV
ncbi:hypothetical protein HPP92_006606 [Vanilla planifolia]|uniref:CASP-like protein n=1 Tax=Vanilla planifolia TaxID=51239 RepID=A0A835V8M0_VANPL|nr:hypothetical protein HPP92_006606 [Vanilla planifolia]